MRFTSALLASSVAALELPSYFFNQIGGSPSTAESWGTNNGSSLTDLTFLSSRFNNRMRFGSPALGKLNDRRGYVSGGTSGTQTTQNMNWFGGCYLKPSKDYEAYFNDSNSAIRFHTYATAASTAPTNAPDFKNKNLTGVVAYRCHDTAPTADTTLVNCEIAAKARGFKWDQLNQVAQLKLDLFRPYVQQINTIDYDNSGGVDADETAKASSAQYNLTENCLVQKLTAGDGTSQDSGLLTDLAANAYKMDQTAGAPVTGKYEYANSHFALELTGPTALQALETNDTNVNNRLTEASVRLTFHLAGGAATNSKGSTYSTHALASDTSTNTAYPDALTSLTAEPPIGCCKFESWNMRTFKRAAERIKTEQTRMCEYTKSISYTAGVLDAIVGTPRSGIDSCDLAGTIV